MAIFYQLDDIVYGCPYMTIKRNKKMKSHKHITVAINELLCLKNAGA